MRSVASSAGNDCAEGRSSSSSVSLLRIFRHVVSAHPGSPSSVQLRKQDDKGLSFPRRHLHESCHSRPPRILRHAVLSHGGLPSPIQLRTRRLGAFVLQTVQFVPRTSILERFVSNLQTINSRIYSSSSCLN